MAAFAPGRAKPSRHTRNKDRPISVKSIIQTAGITPSGGVNQGFVKVGYQVDTDMFVKTDPREPAPWHAIMHKMSFEISSILIFFVYLTPPALARISSPNMRGVQ